MVFSQGALPRAEDLVDLSMGDVDEKRLIAARLAGKEWAELVDSMTRKGRWLPTMSSIGHLHPANQPRGGRKSVMNP
jgi:hypothetical protein